MMLAVDTSDIWTGQLFRAMARLYPTCGIRIEPGPGRLRSSAVAGCVREGAYRETRLRAPRRWGGRLAVFFSHSLAAEMRRAAGDAIQAVVFTSPVYRQLVPLFRGVPRAYYAADDYRHYGWPERTAVRWESEMVAAVDWVFTVSSELRRRFVSDYGVAPDRVIVSPNAVCEQLIPLRPAGCARAAPAPVPPQFRPLAGMIGVVSDRVRLDWAVDLLRRVPWLHLAIIGPVSRPLSAGTAASLAVLEGMRDRVVFCGAQPYESLTRFACACDVCLILLNEHGINPAASPTRFFSCLPAARPILASAGCPQLEEFSPLVRVFADPRALADAVVELRATGFDDGWNTDRWRAARQHTWSLRAELMLRRIGLLREAA